MAVFLETFEAQTIGAAPANWTNRWAGLSPLVQAGGAGKVLQWNPTTFARRGYSYNTAGSFADGEILVKYRLSAAPPDGAYAWVSGRVGGSTGSETAVSFHIVTVSGVRSAVLHQYANNAATNRVEVPLPALVLTEWFYIRLKFDGANVSAKIWQAGTDEPATATISGTTTVTTAGFAGVTATGAGAGIISNLDYIGFATTAAETVPIDTPTGPLVSIALKTAAGAPAASLTGLRWAWFDQVDPALMVAPASKGTGSTDASGQFTVRLSSSTLTAGQTGALLLSTGDGVSAGLYQVALAT